MDCKQFSVSMCVYGKNNPEHFDIAVGSIINQSVKPSEVILVVDGPVPPEIDAVISKYEEFDFFKVYRFQENKGHGEARRFGLEKCTNELVAIMDADDISAPDRFEVQLKAFESDNSVDIVGGDISEFVDSEENVVAYRRVPKTDAEIKEYLKKRCPLNHVSVMFKKSAVEKAGGYLDLFWNEDYYLWIRMAAENAIMANTGTVLVNVRTGADMYNRRGGKKYFKSEKFLQKYMLDRKMIGRFTYFSNVLKRWIVQRLLPNKLRGWVFRTFARKNVI